jgi:hypothetical protein
MGAEGPGQVLDQRHEERLAGLAGRALEDRPQSGLLVTPHRRVTIAAVHGAHPVTTPGGRRAFRVN